MSRFLDFIAYTIVTVLVLSVSAGLICFFIKIPAALLTITAISIVSWAILRVTE